MTTPHRYRSLARPSLVALLCSGLLVSTAAGQTKYQNADEAFGVGAAFVNSRNYAASLEPLEAALKLAPDDAYRLKVYRALLPAYRQLADIDKMFEAELFILEKSSSAPEQSIHRRQLLSFLHERGKVDVAVERLEKRLQKDPNDRTALFVLCEIYAELKKDPKRSAELIERLARVAMKEGKPLDVQMSAQLAQQYVKAGKLQEGAELYEKIAPLDPKLSAWHWKDAAEAWLKANDKKRALEAARKSAASQPEQRSELLTHFWHRSLGDVFLATGAPDLAVKHFEQAIQKTTIAGYVKQCQEKLAEAQRQAESLKK